jgi:hypothetical protein
MSALASSRYHGSVSGSLLVLCAVFALPSAAGASADPPGSSPKVGAAADVTASASREEAPRRVRTGLGVAGLPLANFNTDAGLGYGARVALYDYGAGQTPYRHALTLQFFQTTNGLMAHFLSLDSPRFEGSLWRLEANLRLMGDKFSPYYGLGNASKVQSSYVTCRRAPGQSGNSACADNPAFRGTHYYQYQSLSPEAALKGRRDLGGPWRLLAIYRFRLTMLDLAYDERGSTARDSKLMEDWMAGERLPGLSFDNWGRARPVRTGELTAGIVYDSRTPEFSPTRGFFHEVSVRGAAAAVGSELPYWGANLTLRGYQHLDARQRLVVAGRLVGDVLGGDAPFFLLSAVGGLNGPEAIGGLGSVRGLRRNRFVGRAKAFGNAELRWKFAHFRPGKHDLELTGIGGVDGGRVWKDLAADGPALALHYAAVGGMRIIWDDAFIVRVDYGQALTERSNGLYIDFFHVF